jgi:predicted amidophosphoribosyltransferase
MRPAFRICPGCGDRWPTLDREALAGDTCPSCRLPGPKAQLSRRVGGRLPDEASAARVAPPPSLEEQA